MLEEELALIRSCGSRASSCSIRTCSSSPARWRRRSGGRIPPGGSCPRAGTGPEREFTGLLPDRLSHIDPVENELFLGRFLNEELTEALDIDLDFPATSARS